MQMRKINVTGGLHLRPNFVFDTFAVRDKYIDTNRHVYSEISLISFYIPIKCQTLAVTILQPCPVCMNVAQCCSLDSC